MLSLLAIVFLVELAIQIVNSVGAAAVSNGLWSIYSRIPSKRAVVYAEHRQLQRECLEARRVLQATSSQDEFAKWARLRRQHDKLMAELEKKKTILDADRRKFDTAVTAARLVLTRGPQYALPFWYARTPLFWLPHGWFPAYAEWLLAFPRAPRGSVSIASWQLACTGVLVLLRDTVLALVALARQAKAKTKETPLAAAAATPSSSSSSAGDAAAAGKKEQ